MAQASPTLQRACAGLWVSRVSRVCGVARCPMSFLQGRRTASPSTMLRSLWFWIIRISLSSKQARKSASSAISIAVVIASTRLTAKRSVCAMSMTFSWIQDWDGILSPLFPKERSRKSLTVSQRSVGLFLKKRPECSNIRPVARKQKAN